MPSEVRRSPSHTLLHTTRAQGGSPMHARRFHMSTETIFLVILVVFLLGGGGFFWSRRSH
jgi:hypothetical protein